VKPFDLSLTPNILVDTLKVHRAGYLMFQTTAEGKVNLIKCGSVSTRPSWVCMSPIELETCGIVWALNHCNHYLRGCDLIKLHVNHLPLVMLLQGPLEDRSECIIRLRAEILDYRLEILFTPGKRHKIADCLGRQKDGDITILSKQWIKNAFKVDI
jgi:hypothetical protein